MKSRVLARFIGNGNRDLDSCSKKNGSLRAFSFEVICRMTGSRQKRRAAKNKGKGEKIKSKGKGKDNDYHGGHGDAQRITEENCICFCEVHKHVGAASPNAAAAGRTVALPRAAQPWEEKD